MNKSIRIKTEEQEKAEPPNFRISVSHKFLIRKNKS